MREGDKLFLIGRTAWPDASIAAKAAADLREFGFTATPSGNEVSVRLPMEGMSKMIFPFFE
jgi:hypothetical protein